MFQKQQQMLVYHPAHNPIQMLSKFLMFQSKFLTSLGMVLIMQHKNRLGMLWGKSTEERVRLDTPQLTRALSWKRWSQQLLLFRVRKWQWI